MTWIPQPRGRVTPIQRAGDLPAALADLLARADLKIFTGLVTVDFAGDEFVLQMRHGRIVAGRRVHGVCDGRADRIALQPGASL